MDNNTAATPVVFGEVLFDYFEDDDVSVLGGAPFNVAWHLQGFGLSPVFISRVGNDEAGENIKSVMSQRDMDINALQTDYSHPTGRVSIKLKDGQPTFSILDEQAYDYIDHAALPDVKPGLLYHGSLGVRHEVSAAALQAIMTKYNPRVFLDVNLRDPWWQKDHVLALINQATWVKINDDEINALVNGNAPMLDKAYTLQQQYGLELVILTEGKRGALAVDSAGGVYHVNPESELEIVDTVGAGDAFASVCITGIVNDWPVQDILDRAQAFASLVVQQRGATVSDSTVYTGLLDVWRQA